MVRFRKTIDVASPPEDVWDLLVHLGKASRWQPWTRRATARSGEVLTDGDLFDVVNETLGVRLAWTGEAAAEPPSRLAFRQVAGDFSRMEGAWELTPHETRRDVTRVHFDLHVELPFVLPRMVTQEEAHRELSGAADACLFNLKTLLEDARPARTRPTLGYGWYAPAAPPRPSAKVAPPEGPGRKVVN